MITFPNGLDDSSSESTSIFILTFGGLIITKLLGLIKSCDLTKLLENLSSTVDIILLAALVPISDPNLLTPASNAFVPNVLAVF